MSTTKTIVDEKYNEAIQSLKKINNVLFYEELKSLLKEREQTIAELNGEVVESVKTWQQHYEAYITRTEKLLADLKELQRNDYKFMDMQTEKVIEAIRLSQEEIHALFSKEISEQASIMNVKYESIGERLSFILKSLTSVEANLIAMSEQSEIQQRQDQKDLQGKWDKKWEEKWMLYVDMTRKKEERLKKWLIGLAVGQGVSLIILLVFLIFW